MNALALLNNLDREFARPFYTNNWAREMNDHKTFASSMKFDDAKSVWNLTVELAGVTKENVKIDTADGYVQLTGEKTKGVNLGQFEGRYALPKGVDIEKIEATFEDGILNVAIPMAEKKSTKTIQIK